MKKIPLLNRQKEGNLNIDLLGLTLFGLAVIIGAVVRVNFVSGSEFPLNDGGYFLRMTEDLITNGFSLPEYSTYNNAAIPFAYPPLGFYIVGGLNFFFGFPLLGLFFYFPLIISIITIPVYFYLTGKFFDSLLFRGLATYIFATLPRSFEWFVMGGGVTRSLGLVFGILSVGFFDNLITNNRKTRHLLLFSVFGALTILSHPVASLFLVFSIFILAIYKGIDKTILGESAIAAGLILLFTSPWWVSVLNHHELTPFINAGNTGHINWFEVKNLITQVYGYENPYFLSLIGVLALVGLLDKDRNLSFKVGSLVIIGYIVIPRGGVDYLSTYYAILGALGVRVIISSWGYYNKTANQSSNQLQLTGKSRAVILFLVVYLMLGAYTYKFVNNKSQLRLTAEDIQSMEWIRDNTDISSNILIVPQNRVDRFWWNDYRAEWLPVISNRVSIITVQGYEWLPDIFTPRIIDYVELRNCVNFGAECLIDWNRERDNVIDYVLVAGFEEDPLLIKDYSENKNFRLVYQNFTNIIFEYNVIQ